MSADPGQEGWSPRFFGQRVLRREDPRYLLGRARFVDDIERPRMAYASFVRSPEAHARVLGVNLEAALGTEGVIHALSGEMTRARARPIRCDSTMASWQGTEYHALALDRVRFVGEAVACVLAEDRYLAEDAAELVTAAYERLPPVTSIAEAIAPGAPLCTRPPPTTTSTRGTSRRPISTP